jgi:putative ABC transport system ATP-binding protein
MGELYRDQRGVFQESFSVEPVALSHVSKLYNGGVVALDDVSVVIARGDFVALTGPSGCGKSTLLHLAGCINLPTSGHVYIEGRTTSELSDDELTYLRRDRIGTVFQFFNLLPTLSVAENVALPLVLQGCARAEIERRVARALDAVGIAERAGSVPGRISGGEVQRAAIARAIVHDPAIVLADEPTGNLDSRNGEIVLGILRRLANEGQSILMATHSAQAAAYADRSIRMRDGRVEPET